MDDFEEMLTELAREYATWSGFYVALHDVAGPCVSRPDLVAAFNDGAEFRGAGANRQ